MDERMRVQGSADARDAQGATAASRAGEHRYPFFSDTACPYFPCHEGVAPEEFNCLFCYCPLYALGPACGGRFRYTEAGTKDCTACSVPHEGDGGTALVKRHFKELSALAARQRVEAAAAGARQEGEAQAASARQDVEEAPARSADGVLAASSRRHSGAQAVSAGRADGEAAVCAGRRRAGGTGRASSCGPWEERLRATVAAVAPADASAGARARATWNAVAKPIGSLGTFEDLIVKIAALTGTAHVHIGRRACVVFCADNGVVAEGVTQCGQDVTTAIATAVARGTSSVCAMARPAKADTFAVDVGMVQPSDDPRVLARAVARGTRDIAKGAAMTREQAAQAVMVGVDVARELHKRGYDIIASGEMGIGNTTTSAAVAAVFLGCEAREVVGRGAGLSDAGLALKIDTVDRALAVNDPDPDDVLDVLSCVGGFDIAALCGLFIGGARFRVPIVMDGFISAVAALCATRMCPPSDAAVIPSHVSSEPAAARLIAELGCTPPLHAGMHLGEGTGAVCLLPLLDCTLALYRGSTFSDQNIETYEVNPQ